MTLPSDRIRPPDDATLIEAKRALRRSVRSSLAAVTPEQNAAWSLAIRDAVLARPDVARLLDNTSPVAMLFTPMPEELDVTLIARAWTSRGGRVAVPRVDWSTRSMIPVAVPFIPSPPPGAPIAPKTDTKPLAASPPQAPTGVPTPEKTPTGWTSGRGGMLEPDPAIPGIDPSELSLVIVPGLAFDSSGNRLGRGAGFYDRFLSRADLRALKIGVAFDVQVVPRVPISSGDVAMDGVVTPSGDIVRR